MDELLEANVWNAKVILREIQERLGHSDIALTLNTYNHMPPSMQNEAAAKLDELLTPIEFKDNLLREVQIGYDY